MTSEEFEGIREAVDELIDRTERAIDEFDPWGDDRGLSPTGAIYALFAFLAFVAFVPAWVWWVNNNQAALSLEATFLATLILPATVILYLTGWIQGASQ
jgi:hypothetical protein